MCFTVCNVHSYDSMDSNACNVQNMDSTAVMYINFNDSLNINRVINFNKLIYVSVSLSIVMFNILHRGFEVV